MGLTIFIIKYLDFISAFNNKKISNDSSSNPKKKKKTGSISITWKKKQYYKTNINIKKSQKPGEKTFIK